MSEVQTSTVSSLNAQAEKSTERPKSPTRNLFASLFDSASTSVQKSKEIAKPSFVVKKKIKLLKKQPQKTASKTRNPPLLKPVEVKVVAHKTPASTREVEKNVPKLKTEIHYDGKKRNLLTKQQLENLLRSLKPSSSS